jgi:drug/metabolite transporter (DMT)-like permease
MAAGVIAALVAAFAWSLNFIVPFVIGDYSVFDFALFRFLISGLIGLSFLAFNMQAVRKLSLADWLIAFLLGLIGYLGYFLAVVGAAVYAGPTIAPAILGLVPVVLALAGNRRQRTVSWKDLTLPLTLSAVGLLLVNSGSVNQSSAVITQSLVVGICLAFTAVGLWTWFGILNQSALAKRPQIDADVWTALITSGAGLGMLVFVPVGSSLGVFEIPRLGLRWETAAPLYIWETALACGASVGGALAWTFAAQRLPVVLSAQLITTETLFGTIFGLVVRHRWPTLAESVGMSLLMVGVMLVIRTVYGQRALSLEHQNSSALSCAAQICLRSRIGQ